MRNLRFRASGFLMMKPGFVESKDFPNWYRRCIKICVGFWKGALKMLNWALTFFIVALVAAVLGFTGVAVAAAGVAKILFVVFLVLFLVSLIAHTTRRV